MKRVTIILLLSVAILLMLGAVMLYSSTTHHPDLERLHRHFCWMAIGGVCCLATSWSNYSWLTKGHGPKWLLGLAVILLISVFLPGIGVAKNGAHRWLPFGQPSELAKICLIIFLAHYGATHQARMKERNIGFVFPALGAGLVILLVFLEPDWGTAALLAFITLAMLAVAGAHWGYLLSAMIIGSEVFALLLLNNSLRLERVLSFLDPEKYQDGVGWQVWHSVLSLGSGGWLGCFFGEGRQKNDFVPEQPTDFVLSLIGEEVGLVGTLLVVLLFAIAFLCGMRVVWRIADPFGQLLASGVTLLIAVQALINIGVVTSSLPNKGIPLPFISYGGSSLVCTLICLGVLISVARHGPLRTIMPAANPFAAGSKLKAIGPVGSLLHPSREMEAKGFWQRFLRVARSRRDASFPSRPLHAYQRPPRPRG